MFYDVFEKLCLKKGVSRQRACTDCGFSRTAWNKWKTGGIPNGEGLQRMADYFGVSVDYLLGKEETKKAPEKREPNKEDIKIALFGGDGEVTDEMWEEALFAAQLIKERYKRKKKEE